MNFLIDTVMDTATRAHEKVQIIQLGVVNLLHINQMYRNPYIYSMRRIYIPLILALMAGAFYAGYRFGRPEEADKSELVKLQQEYDSLERELVASDARSERLMLDTASEGRAKREALALAANRLKRTNQLKNYYGKEIQKLRDSLDAITTDSLILWLERKYLGPKGDSTGTITPGDDTGQYAAGNDSSAAGFNDSRPADSTGRGREEAVKDRHAPDRGDIQTEGVKSPGGESDPAEGRLDQHSSEIQTPAKSVHRWRYGSGCWWHDLRSREISKTLGGYFDPVLSQHISLTG